MTTTDTPANSSLNVLVDSHAGQLSHTGRLRRLAAFTQNTAGGNPAGVWIGETLPSSEEMQKIATQVGFSETAFIAPASGKVRMIRYYSPEAEVAFCGHATIASGVALGDSDGDNTYLLNTTVGEVPVTVQTRNNLRTAALTSVKPEYQDAPESLLENILAILGWKRDELDPAIPPARAYAGNWHFVLATASKERLDNLQYDFEALKQLMLDDDLTTLQLVWRDSEGVFHSRNPFPVGGVVEDPATGAAAAALGGYLREAGLIKAPAEITLRQGEIMGRPGLLDVSIPVTGGISVSGTAVSLD